MSDDDATIIELATELARWFAGIADAYIEQDHASNMYWTAAERK